MNDAKTDAAAHSRGAEALATDRLFAVKRDHLVDFAFDEAVAAVFPDMIRRSVPGYETVLQSTALIAAKHLAPGGRCYDLGCSLGAASQAVLAAVGERHCEIVAVDQSSAMLERARMLAEAPEEAGKPRQGASESRIRWLAADIRQLALQPADVVILNYTLQFLPPVDRLPLLVKVRDCLTERGVLVLTEKLNAGDYFEALHLDFKRANGYSELEIAQKRATLENVMRIDDAHTHLHRLREAGFADAKLCFQCLNWGSFVAWATDQSQFAGRQGTRGA